jgi:hypothetical protein
MKWKYQKNLQIINITNNILDYGHKGQEHIERVTHNKIPKRMLNCRLGRRTGVVCLKKRWSNDE